jgi:hypothetical protein
MILGAQWYILFNMIAGAMAYPNDFREAASNFRMRGWQWWRSPAARNFADLNTQTRKEVFARHLLASVPLAQHIKHVLDERPGHRAPRVRFEQELKDHLSDAAAEETSTPW